MQGAHRGAGRVRGGDAGCGGQDGAAPGSRGQIAAHGQPADTGGCVPAVPPPPQPGVCGEPTPWHSPAAPRPPAPHVSVGFGGAQGCQLQKRLPGNRGVRGVPSGGLGGVGGVPRQQCRDRTLCCPPLPPGWGHPRDLRRQLKCCRQSRRAATPGQEKPRWSGLLTTAGCSRGIHRFSGSLHGNRFYRCCPTVTSR